jgi:DNA primase
VYVRECSRLMDIGEEVLLSEVAKFRRAKLYDNKPYTPPEMPAATPVVAPPTGVLDPSQYFEKAEEEIIYYLLKYGTQHLFTVVHDEQERAISVAEYITSELHNDELELKNPHYRQLFEEYRHLSGNSDEERITYFINHPDRALSDVAIYILSDLPSLTVQRYANSEEPETLRLPRIIPKALLVYKARCVKVFADEVSQRLQEAQAANHEEEMKTLMERHLLLQQNSKRLSEELRRLIF